MTSPLEASVFTKITHYGHSTTTPPIVDLSNQAKSLGIMSPIGSSTSNFIYPPRQNFYTMYRLSRIVNNESFYWLENLINFLIILVDS
jgi:hypothetical protein